MTAENPKIEYFEDGDNQFLHIEAAGSLEYRYPNKLYTEEGWIVEPAVAAIDGLAVLESARRHGYGKLLLSEAYERLKAEGAEYCRLGIINPISVIILESLRERGTIQGAVYQPTAASTRLVAQEGSSVQLYEQGEGVAAPEAYEIARSYEAAWAAFYASGSEEEPQERSIIAVAKL
jgi:GNAT superfamily N-acetyltransferase